MADVREFPKRPSGGAGRKKRRLSLGVMLALLVPIVGVTLALTRLWVDLLWFDELGQRDVMTTRIQWGFVVGMGSALVAGLIVAFNLLFATRVGKNDLYIPFLAEPVSGPDGAPTVTQPTVPHFVMRPVSVAVSFAIAILTGLTM